MRHPRLQFLILAVIIGLVATTTKAQPILEETIEKTCPIQPTAKISIRNSDGSIRIYGADINEIRLQAIKRAYRVQRLAQISVKISVEPGQVSIDTEYPSKSKWGFCDRSGTVDYVIVVPWTCDIIRADLVNGELLVEGMRGGKVHARLENGRLFGHNCFTDLHVAVANGGLDVSYDWWEGHKFSLDAEIVNGNARAFIPGDAAFHLVASSVNGHVVSDFIEKEHRQSGGVPKIDLLVGETSVTDIKVHAINGSIKIAEANL
jgi:DUF4097 and DUF4098 domain-containing protein YvlB